MGTRTSTRRRGRSWNPRASGAYSSDYAENVKGYRVFDLGASKVKVTRSVKLDEREVDGIYETLPAGTGTVIHVSEDAHDAVTPAPVERQPAVEEPMEGVENDAPDVTWRAWNRSRTQLHHCNWRRNDPPPLD
ncbi:hypothetical protein PF003_g35500 [Phytophthora fragariae]|nr:hypothetical protein PF003_g35500 [Phytophthora fragariae]